MCSPSRKKDQPPSRERRVCAFHRSHDKSPKPAQLDANVFSCLIRGCRIHQSQRACDSLQMVSAPEFRGEKFLISTTDNAGAAYHVGFHWAFIAQSAGGFAVTRKSSVRCLPTSPGA
jgi:hypothetical protein